MSNNKQSSLDFYRKNLHSMVSGGSTEFKTEVEIFEQAKAMHKEESVDFALYAMMAESFNDLPEATKKQLQEAIEVKYKEHYKL